MVINSLSNEKLKKVNELKEKKYRELYRAFIVEGTNSIKDLPAEYILEFFVNNELMEKHNELITSKISNNKEIQVNIVSNNVFGKISDTINPSGIIAICKILEPKSISCETIGILDRIRDPGNLGTIFRSAAAMGINDLILIDCVDPYNDKVVRSSLGAIFHLNFIIVSNTSEIKGLLNSYKIVSLSFGGTNLYQYVNKGKIALVVGNEANGISKELLAITDSILTIPMPSSNMESLNAAVSFSIAASFLTNNKEQDFFNLFSLKS
jgi:RNA methyltransferase, TrmH family